ncbi:Uu.00g035820.m01.CDS01 [Anthostomella pinea]|uniref:Uu.00g035820.m01.CDS01 n=1 Tax=Anthostomella pinea TaxID=933095 RepID=A0AAI8YB34_9PEZI|nr:Uu.00g035820.m01.CDS01 [Anthostomella pinea]
MESTTITPSPNGDSDTSPPLSTSRGHLPMGSPAAAGAAVASASQFFASAGPITLDPSMTPSSALNPRSCVTCRKRKVRCDKHMPCGNCRKALIQCVFPAPGRAPRRPRPKDPNAPPKQTSEREIELMKRLRKLEGIVEDLSGQIEFETTRHAGSSSGESPETTIDVVQEKEPRKQNSNIYSENLPAGYPPAGQPKPFRANSASVKRQAGDVYKDFGRLVLNEKGRTRYVSNAFWSKINDEINELRAETQRLTDDDSDYSDDGDTPVTDCDPAPEQHFDHHSFIMGYSSSEVDLAKLHPLPSQIEFIWQIYIESVDPVVKILHVPTMSKAIRELRTNMSSIPPGLEALMFSIYYAALTSMEDEEVKMNFNAEKGDLISRYRYATEQALAKAHFLTTSELVVAQAFVLFLVLVRRYDDTRFAWTLTGLAIRIGQSLGLHREGTHFENLSPFDIEMRRRLWWAICILDIRSAEDQGTELTIAEGTFDTRHPMNINDVDIYPEMAEFPEERKGATDVTFCLIRYEICSFVRKMHSASGAMSACPKDPDSNLQEREALLIAMYERIDDKYLRDCADKETDILNWVAATIARLIMAKMSLIIYQPLLMTSAAQDLSSEIQDRLFMSSVEVVEYNKILNGEPKCRPWRWLFQTYTQWHAVAYLLLEVCRRPWTASVERGWMALTATLPTPGPAEAARPAVCGRAAWIPLRKLMIKAKRHRDEEIARLRADPQAAQDLDIKECNKVPPASFQHIPSSVRHSLAQERWRKLVGTKGPEKAAQFSCLRSSDATQQPVGAQGEETVQGEAEGSMPATEMQYVDHVMAQPYFSSQDFFSVAYAADPTELARQAFFSSGGPAETSGGFKSQPSVPIENFSSSGGAAYDSSTTLGGKAPRTQADTAAAPVDPVADDNPPPWLWANPWGSGFEVAADVTVMDDQDVNMDAEEDTNWHTWMDNGFAMGRAGFAGGI